MIRKVPILLLSLVVVLVLTAPAYAQTGPTVPPGPVTLPVAVTLILSLLLGFVNMTVQSGSIFGITTTPKAWLPELTLFGTFLGGVLAYFTSLGSAFAVSGTTIFYGIVMGLMSLLAAAAPALARHAVTIVPSQIRAARAQTLPPPKSN